MITNLSERLARRNVVIDTIRAFLKGKGKSSVPEIARTIEAARAAEAEAAGEIDRLNHDRPRILLDGTDAELRELDDAIATAGRQRDRAAAMIAALAAPLAAAEAELEEARRRAAFAEAHSAFDTYQRRLVEIYPRAYAMLEALIKEAEGLPALRDRAHDLPAGKAWLDLPNGGLLAACAEIEQHFVALPHPDWVAQYYLNPAYDRKIIEAMRTPPPIDRPIGFKAELNQPEVYATRNGIRVNATDYGVSTPGWEGE